MNGDAARGTSVHGPNNVSDSCRMPAVHDILTVRGAPAGAMVSFRTGRCRITWNVQLLVRPHSSVATAMTVFVVSPLKKEPEGGDEITVTELQLLVADRDQLTLVPQDVRTMSPGQTIVGRLVQSQMLVIVKISKARSRLV